MTTSVSTFTDSLLSPLDRARTALFVRAARVGVLRPVLLEKRRRVPALVLAHASVALVLSLLAPTLLLVVAPLLLGVPHLLADVRYLVLRPAMPHRLRWLLLGGCAALISSRLLELLGVRGLPRVELAGAGLLTLAVIALGAPRLKSMRVVSALLLTSVLLAAALLWPSDARLVLGHGHNVVALVIWALVFCRSRTRALGLIAVILGSAALLIATPLAWWGFKHGLQAAFGLHAFAAADALAPRVTDASLALGVVASFAFLQSVHYAVWLHAIPQEATRGEATLTFRMSFRALVTDLGRPLLGVATLLVLSVPLAACFGPLRAQATYLELAAFHAYLELAALALFWVRGGVTLRAQPGEACC
jgi:hypothetical protein